MNDKQRTEPYPNKELQQEAQQYGYIGLFSHRDSIQEAYDYSASVAKAEENTPAILTAIHVLLNTSALRFAEAVRVIEELEEMARATRSFLEDNARIGSQRRRKAMLDGVTSALKAAEPYVRIEAKAPSTEDEEPA